MAKLWLSIGWSHISYACTIQKTPSHGMRVFPMSNITTIEPCIAQLATTPFRWGWDSNYWAPWMLHLPWKPPRLTRPLLHQKLTKPPGSLSRSNTSANRFIIFYRSLMPSTNITMINIRCHISFRWVTKSFVAFAEITPYMAPSKDSPTSVMVHTPSPRLWVTMILSSTLPPFLVCIQSSTWLSFDHISHHYWTPQR
jgi:hypothetical protein